MWHRLKNSLAGKSSDEYVVIPIDLPNGLIETTLRVYTDGLRIADLVFLSSENPSPKTLERFAEIAYDNYSKNN